MKKWFLLALAASAVFCAPAQAQTRDETPTQWRFVGRLGAGFGGDTILDGHYNGDGTYWSLSTGAGLKVALGADYRLQDKWVVQATVGRDVSTVPADEGDQYFVRMPVEVLGLYDYTENIRVGGGLRYAANAKVEGNGAYANDPVNGNYESSLGFVLEAQYVLAATQRKGSDGQAGLGFRFVSESYKSRIKTYNADHAEIVLFLNY